MAATLAAAGARDPRPPARALRAPGERAARPPDRRARARGALPEHQRPQPRCRLLSAARAVPHLGGGEGRADRGGRVRHQARRPEPDEGTSHPGDPRRAGGPAGPRLARRGARDEALGLPRPVCQASAGRPRPWSCSSPSDAPRSRSTPRLPGRRPPGPVQAQGLVRGGARRDARHHPSRGRLRAAHQPDPPRAGDLPAAATLRRVRASPHVSLVPPAQGEARAICSRASEAEHVRHVRNRRPAPGRGHPRLGPDQGGLAGLVRRERPRAACRRARTSS